MYTKRDSPKDAAQIENEPFRETNTCSHRLRRARSPIN